MTPLLAATSVFTTWALSTITLPPSTLMLSSSPPAVLAFMVLTSAATTLPGTLIDYRIRVHGIPIRWRTEIAEWQPPHRFVDVQLRGPYTLWHHTHTFDERDGGTLCADRVRYRPRGGALMNWLFVRRDVERIFRHRRQRMHELLGTKANETVQPASNRNESCK
jgi:ligand-binding SRPBCC domain-containing protein